MSRSAADATRFTATSPHAYSKPPTRSSPSNPTIPTSRRGPPINPNHSNPSNPTGETPQQKVARLREARLAAREGQISTWDRVVVRGRIWADIAHRFTVLGLMGASVLAGGVTTFALTDMIIYNRRKRNEYYAEQTALLQSKLSAAITAERTGQPLDDEQVLVLNRERVRLEGEDRKKKKKEEGSWSKWLFGGLKAEEVREVEGDRAGGRGAERGGGQRERGV